ncbi:hypothetical protein [Streptomyces sp. NBC_01614]|uniref:hypothetical protein n=1 Tax=Streptomyces sp. NBC_01614 TaxID=2975897 RepID=UPI003869FB71
MTPPLPATDRRWALDRAVDDLVRGEIAWAACGLRRRRELRGRLKTDTRPLGYGSPEKGETMTITTI